MQIQKSKAFTLIEILVVMGILAGLMAYFVPIVMNRQKEANRKNNIIKLSDVKTALVQYKMAFGKYPTEQEGLKVLTNDAAFKKASMGDAPLKEDQIIDSKEQPIIYHRPPNILHKDKFKTFELIWVGTGASEEEAEIPADGD